MAVRWWAGPARSGFSCCLPGLSAPECYLDLEDWGEVCKASMGSGEWEAGGEGGREVCGAEGQM